MALPRSWQCNRSRPYPSCGSPCYRPRPLRGQRGRPTAVPCTWEIGFRVALSCRSRPVRSSRGPERGYGDVSAKYGLLRIGDTGTAPLTLPSPPAGGEGRVRGGRRIETIASGWGYSQDYHDWAVGLPQNDRGEYFLGIPCQQDKRSV